MIRGEISDGRERAVYELERAWRGLSAAQRRLRGRDARETEDLSLPQYYLLKPLLEAEEMSSGELSAHAGLTPATATHMLEQLVRSGIVRRERSTGDRRVVATSLTHRGKRLMQAKDKVVTEKWREAIADLDEAALDHAAEVLLRLIRYVDEL